MNTRHSTNGKPIYVYITSPNQRVIETRKIVADKEHIYGTLNVEATLLAAKTLSDRAFKLYVRMMLHQNGHTYALSPAAINREIGMSEKKYREAVKELINSGFLVLKENCTSHYCACDYQEDSRVIPPEQNDNSPVLDESSAPNEQSPRPLGSGDPAISEREIIHDNTLNNTVNTTNRTSNITSRAMPERGDCYDEDDSIFYQNPEDEIDNEAYDELPDDWMEENEDETNKCEHITDDGDMPF